MDFKKCMIGSYLDLLIRLLFELIFRCDLICNPNYKKWLRNIWNQSVLIPSGSKFILPTTRRSKM